MEPIVIDLSNVFYIGYSLLASMFLGLLLMHILEKLIFPKSSGKIFDEWRHGNSIICNKNFELKTKFIAIIDITIPLSIIIISIFIAYFLGSDIFEQVLFFICSFVFLIPLCSMTISRFLHMVAAGRAEYSNIK